MHFSESILTDRDFETYVTRLHLDDGILETAQVIVDLGAGFRQEFARGVTNYNPQVQAISIDPRLALSLDDDLADLFPEEHPERVEGRTNPQPGTIAATATSLPVADESVDLLVAQHSIPQYLTTQQMTVALAEIHRILKPGGEARLYPVKRADLDGFAGSPLRIELEQFVGGKAFMRLTK